MTCHRLLPTAITHVWPLALRGIRRAMRRHAHRVIGAGVAAVCAATPPAVVLLIPSPAVSLDMPLPVVALQPTPVPEPTSLAVLAVGAAGIIFVRKGGSNG